MIHFLNEIGDWNGLKKEFSMKWCDLQGDGPNRYPCIAVTHEGRGRHPDYQTVEAAFVYAEDARKLIEGYEVWAKNQIAHHKAMLERLTGKVVNL